MYAVLCALPGLQEPCGGGQHGGGNMFSSVVPDWWAVLFTTYFLGVKGC